MHRPGCTRSRTNLTYICHCELVASWRCALALAHSRGHVPPSRARELRAVSPLQQWQGSVDPADCAVSCIWRGISYRVDMGMSYAWRACDAN